MFHGELFSYQKEAVTFALKQKHSICSLEMGLGKTIVSLYLAANHAKKVLIVCPAYLKNNWKEEIAKFCPDLKATVISYTSLHKLDESSFDCIISDEAHYLKNYKAKRTKTFSLIVHNCNPKYLLLLSGTPIKNRVPDLWSLLAMCSTQIIPRSSYKFDFNYYRFCYNFCLSSQKTINGYKITEYHGVKNVKALKKLIAPVYHRKRLDQISLELPDQIEKSIVTKSKSQFDSTFKDILKVMKDNGSTLSFMTQKSANAIAKVKDTCQLAKEIGDQNSKAIIYTVHIESARLIAKELGVIAVTGSTPIEARAKAVQDFKSKNQFLVATLGSLSTGVNLTWCQHMIFNDFSYTPSEMDQAKKRIHRIGQKKTCFYYYMFSSKLDQKIYDLSQSKKQDASKIED